MSKVTPPLFISLAMTMPAASHDFPTHGPRRPLASTIVAFRRLLVLGLGFDRCTGKAIDHISADAPSELHATEDPPSVRHRRLGVATGGVPREVSAELRWPSI